MKITETNLGYLIEGRGFKGLMGGQKASLFNLQESFPEFKFNRVRQTHGSYAIEAFDGSQDFQVEADAQFTKANGLALCVSTADCIPLLVHDPVSGYIAAIHAGWRGVAQQIVPKTLQKLFQLGALPGTMEIVLGPHIQMKSFEVSVEVCDELLSSIDASPKDKGSPYFKDLSYDKALVDMAEIMHQQLKMCGILFDHISDLQIDTRTDPRFHSHRRDREKAGRQMSFIAKI